MNAIFYLKNRLSKTTIHLIKLFIGLVIVILLINKYDFGKVLTHLMQVDLRLFCLAWAYGAIGIIAYAIVHKITLQPLKMNLTLWKLIKISFQIRFYSLFMPGATNLLIKWYKLSQSGQQPAQALVLMGFTRLLHILALLILTAVGIYYDVLFPWTSIQWIILSCIILIVLAFAVLLSPVGQNLCDLIGHLKFPNWSFTKIIENKWSKLWNVIRNLNNISFLCIVILLLINLVGHIFETFQHQTLALAVDLDLNFWVFAWLRGVILVCSMIPFSFSGLGFREASMIGLLIYYGIPEETALAYSIFYFSGFVLTKGIVGGLLEFSDFLLDTTKARKH